MIKKQRESGVTLFQTFGVGDDNYNEAMMVRIADVGNGNYSYIDTLSERKSLDSGNAADVDYRSERCWKQPSLTPRG